MPDVGNDDKFQVIYGKCAYFVYFCKNLENLAHPNSQKFFKFEKKFPINSLYKVNQYNVTIFVLQSMK